MKNNFMQSLELNKESLSTFYNVHYFSLDEYLVDINHSVSGMIGIISPGESSTPHKHHETELFIILSGSGIFFNGKGNGQAVKNGSIIFLNPFMSHWIENTGAVDLTFVSLWWVEKQNSDKSLNVLASQALPSSVMLIATPPTPNGNLHLGHLSGPYLAADILKKYLKMYNVDVKYFCGIDNNQSYVPLKAYQQGCTPQKIIDTYTESIRQTFERADIDLDLLVLPDSSVNYTSYIQDFFATLYENGALIEKEEDAYFCAESGDYIFEAFIRGACPHCGASSDGNACEQCGIPNQCVDLVHAQSKIADGGLIKRKIKRLYLPMNNYVRDLERFWRDTVMKPHLASLCQKMIENGPMSIAVTHPSKWGIHSTIDGYETQVYYVWAEMAACFIYMSEYAGDKDQWSLIFGKKWQGDAELIHCFGFDNGNFFTTLFPCLWWAHGKVKKFPDRFLTNEFLCLEGSKFSTSRGHAIWGHEFFAENDSDICRFFLALNSPESYQTNFKRDEYARVVQQVWVDGVDSIVAILQKDMDRYGWDGVPETGAWTHQHRVFFDEVVSFKRSMESSYHPNNFSLFASTSSLIKYIDNFNHFSKSEQYLFDSVYLANEMRTSLQLRLTALLYLGFFLAPIMPNFARQLMNSFGLNTEVTVKDIECKTLKINVYMRFEENYFSNRTT